MLTITIKLSIWGRLRALFTGRITADFEVGYGREAEDEYDF